MTTEQRIKLMSEKTLKNSIEYQENQLRLIYDMQEKNVDLAEGISSEVQGILSMLKIEQEKRERSEKAVERYKKEKGATDQKKENQRIETLTEELKKKKSEKADNNRLIEHVSLIQKTLEKEIEAIAKELEES